MSQNMRILTAVVFGVIGLFAVIQLSKNAKEETVETTTIEKEKGLLGDIIAGIKGLFGK